MISKKSTTMNPKDKKDAIIGRALSKVIGETSPSDTCPSPEEISALVDQSLEGTERDTIMGHLSHCNRCYEIFSMARKLSKPEKRRTWTYIPIAVAVAAVLLLVIRITDQPPVTEKPVIAHKEEIKTETPWKEKKGPQARFPMAVMTARVFVPPSSAEIAVILARNTDLKSLSDSLRDSQAVAYGFSGSVALEKASFRAGVYLTDIEVTLRTGDKKRSLDLVQRLVSTLGFAEVPEEIISSYSNAQKSIQEAGSTKPLPQDTGKLRSFLSKENVLVFLRFGEWVEGARLASIVRDKALLTAQAVEYFIKELEGKDLPRGVLSGLAELKALSAKDRLDTRDFIEIARVARNIKEMF